MKKGSNWGEGWRWSVKNCVSQSSMTNEQWLSALFSLQHMFFLLSQKLSSLFFNLSRTHTLTPPSTLCICLLLYTPGYHFYLSYLFIYLGLVFSGTFRTKKTNVTFRSPRKISLSPFYFIKWSPHSLVQFVRLCCRMYMSTREKLGFK